MEMLFVFIIHFFIMGSLVLLMSGMITWFLKQIHFGFVIALSMAVGFLYSYLAEIPELAWLALLTNGALSSIGVVIVKIGLSIKQKADQVLVNDHLVKEIRLVKK